MNNANNRNPLNRGATQAEYELSQKSKDEFLAKGLEEEQLTGEEFSHQLVSDQTWAEYGVVTYNTLYRGTGTGSRQVTFLNHAWDVSTQYHACPHQIPLENAQRVSETLGMPIQLSRCFGTGRWRRPFISSARDGRFAGGSPDAIISPDGRFMNATFLIKDEFKEKYNIDLGQATTGVKDSIRAGFSIRNSLDGSSALIIEPVTFRGVCSNTMVHSSKSLYGTNRVFSGQVLEEILKRAKEAFLEIDTKIQKKWKELTTAKKLEDVKDLTGPATLGRFVHRRDIDPIEMRQSMFVALELGNEYLSVWKELGEYKINQAMAQMVVESLPANLYNHPLLKQWLEVTVTKVGDHKETDVKLLDRNKTWYMGANDLTRILTSEDVSGTWRSHFKKYGKVNSLFFSEKNRMHPELTIGRNA